MDYLLPLKATQDTDIAELACYLRRLGDSGAVNSLIVVDGSPAEVFEANADAFGPGVVHVPPDPQRTCRNGKVAAVLTGFALCAGDRVVIADDDVRFEPAQLRRIDQALGGADLVRPQNCFHPLPWHARWDTARIVLNRAFGGDYPGTLGVRLTERLRTRGYCGDVLFENLELMRTVRADGGTEQVLWDLYVRRLPPSTRQFLGQRLRQAYDSTGQPARMLLELGVVPLALASRFGRPARVVATASCAGLAVAAEVGRRRAGGAAYFPATTLAWLPLWVLERGCCAWAALALRLTGRGVRYGSGRLARAASSKRRLRRTRGRAGLRD